MKRKLIVIIVLIVLLLVSLVSCSAYGVFDLILGTEGYSTNLFGDYYLNHISSISNDKIIYSSDIENYDSDEESPLFEGIVYKYAYDQNKGLIVAHCMKDKSNDSAEADTLYVRQYRYIDYNITYDKFLVFSCFENNKISTFDSEEKAIEYCSQKNAKLSEWYYNDIDKPFKSKSTQLIDGYSIATLPGDYSVIKYNDKEIFRGIITKLKCHDNTISFRLRLFDYGYDEEFIGSSNQDLSLSSNETFGYISTGFLRLMREDVLYDKIVTINITTNTISEE